MNHEPLTPQLVAQVGFAASAYADQYMILLGEDDRRYRKLRDAGLRLHTHADLYAAAPHLQDALSSLVALFGDHDGREFHSARHAVHRAKCKTVPCDGYQLQLL
jgi:hypothetical protein